MRAVAIVKRPKHAAVPVKGWFALLGLAAAAGFTLRYMTNPENKGGFFQLLPDDAYVRSNTACGLFLFAVVVLGLYGMSVGQGWLPLIFATHTRSGTRLWRLLPFLKSVRVPVGEVEFRFSSVVRERTWGKQSLWRIGVTTGAGSFVAEFGWAMDATWLRSLEWLAERGVHPVVAPDDKPASQDQEPG